MDRRWHRTGNERRAIFLDDVDRDRFLGRLALVLEADGAGCLAWAPIPNRFHLLLKTVRDPLATVMRRLRTGLDPAPIVSRSRERKKVASRSLVCFWASAELRIPLAELWRRLSLSSFAVSLAEARGEPLRRANGWVLAGIRKLKN